MSGTPKTSASSAQDATAGAAGATVAADVGVLHVVATPIGTLADLSPRARDILTQVDFIACEDTRHTARLLQAYGIHTPLESLHAHNERARADALVEKLRAGQRREAALVTDAGTPGVSDPGSWLVDRAHAAGVRVLSAPGPSSLAAALGACGFESRRVLFSTFLARDNKGRSEEVGVWRAAAPCVAVFFESPLRVAGALAWLVEKLPPQTRACVSRELSKRFEEHARGTLRELALEFARREEQGEARGECVVTVELGSAASLAAQGLRLGADGETTPVETLEELARACLEDVAERGVPLKVAAKGRAEGTRHAAKDVYGAAQSQRDAQRNGQGGPGAGDGEETP
jgi:16S rRNA (cytidine1402-2'-O)-methyltransferase